MQAFSDLSADDQVALLSSPALVVAAGAELLNFDLSFAADISIDLDPAGSSVQWTGAATVHRGCTITLARDLDWGNALVRVYRTYTDQVSGLSARADRGVFCLTAPDRVLGESPSSWQVTGQDRLYLLNRQVGRSYVVAAGVSVLTALGQVFTDAGLSGVLIDSSRSDATVPTAMTWPLIPATDITAADGSAETAAPPDSGQGLDSTSGPATWQQVVNDLLGLISYRAVWADESGMFRCGPYADPMSRAPTFTLDADSLRSAVSVDRTESGNYWATDTPNLYIFLWSNLPDDGSGNPQTPSEGNGLYTVTVTDDWRAAAARNGLVWPTQISYTAAAQSDLVAQGDVRVAADGRLTVTLSAATVPFPASHYDIATVVDVALGGSWKVEAQSWTEPLDGSDLSWTWQRVA